MAKRPSQAATTNLLLSGLLGLGIVALYLNSKGQITPTPTPTPSPSPSPVPTPVPTPTPTPVPVPTVVNMTVNARDTTGSSISVPVTSLQAGASQSGMTPKTFNLDGSIDATITAITTYTNPVSANTYSFVNWTDGVTQSSRTGLPTNTPLTAVYSVSIGTPNNPALYTNANSNYYTVVPGDDIVTIANKKGTTAANLETLNNIVAPFYIYQGQQLRLNATVPMIPFNEGLLSAQQFQHTVVAGEDLVSISAPSGIDPFYVAWINGISAPYYIFVGEVLKLKA